jgi:hypothetical protein
MIVRCPVLEVRKDPDSEKSDFVIVVSKLIDSRPEQTRWLR